MRLKETVPRRKQNADGISSNLLYVYVFSTGDLLWL